MRNPQTTPLSNYLDELIRELGPYESQARQESEKLGLSGISLSRAEAHLLRWFTQSKPVKKAVEIGTLTGLSGLYILDGMIEGAQLWTLEKSEAHAQAARPILQAYANLKNKKVEIVIGDARETLSQLSSMGPFDLVFIDGNKAAYGDYLTWSEQNLKKGGLLVADNVFLGGALFKDEISHFSKKQIHVLKEFNKKLMDQSIWRSALIPTEEGLFIAEKI